MEDKIKNTIIVMVLDESGSMDSCKQGTIDGFNEYIAGMRKFGNKVRLTLTKFNSSKTEVVHSNKPIKDVPGLNNLTYVPSECTPLYDAIGVSISETDEFLKKKSDKPAVLFVIITDGLENSSHQYDQKKIFDLIDKKKKDDKWTFVFLGANQDSFASGGQMSVDLGNIKNYKSDNHGTRQMYAAAAGATLNYMNSGSIQTSNFWTGTEIKDAITTSNAVVNNILLSADDDEDKKGKK